MLSHELLHIIARMGVDVGRSWSFPLRMRIAPGYPFLARIGLVRFVEAAVLCTESEVLVWLLECFSRNGITRLHAAAGISLGALLGRPTCVVGWTCLAAVIGFDFVIATDGVQLRLNFRQLINQSLGIGRHIVVQAIVLVLHADCHVAHEETAHLERGHAHVGTLDLRRAANLILEARKQWSLGVHLLCILPKRLDLDPGVTLEAYIGVEALPLGSILVAHGQEVEALAFDERVPTLASLLRCWSHDGEAGLGDEIVPLSAERGTRHLLIQRECLLDEGLLAEHH